MKITAIEKARSRMLVKHVFFATAAMSTQMVVDNSITTAATDMTKIYYNDDFIKSLKTEVVMFVVAHEVMHILLRHGIRRGNRDPVRANIAMDFAINIMLLDAGFELWEHCCCDARYRGMSFEQIYQLREEEHRRRKNDNSFVPRRERGRPGFGTPDNFDDTEQAIQGGMGGDVLPLPQGMTKEALDKLERRIAGKLQQAAMAARMRGTLPAGLELMIEGDVRPPLPWYDILREWMLALASTGETWNHRNRRFQQVYLPSRKSRAAMGELIVIGDSSGSMNGIYAQLNVEFPSIMEGLNPERLRVVWADDDECSRMEIFERGEHVSIHPKGGGGTDMRRPMKFVEQFDPIVVVLVTDCYTPWPDQEPPYPLITISTTQRKCPYGQTVHFF
jgi:predicted metal-dependent peptidase